jgi:hypothetical protein
VDVTPDAIAPPFFLAAALLALGGALKVVRPRATAQALVDADLPGSGAVARGLGVVEVAAASWAILAPGTGGAVALAVAYLGFAAFLAYVLRTHPDAGSCGCAGGKAVAPSALHLTLDAVAVAVGVAYGAAGGPSAVAWIGALGAGAGVMVVAGLTLAGWLAVVAVTEAPVAWRAWSPPAHVADEQRRDDHDATAEAALASAGIGPGHPSLWPGVVDEVSV